MTLAGRRIILGVSGGIAAYKAVYLLRQLTQAGADVKVVVTPNASRFVGDQTWFALSGHPVLDTLWFREDSPSPHTDLAKWAELIVVAPTTAATLARLAYGLAEDALSTTVLASAAPLVLAPAMHTEMWENHATQRSLHLLSDSGAEVVGPNTGSLSGGDEGVGRMAEPEEIFQVIESMLRPSRLSGKEILITAGGTREPLDPVRYIGNRSSGKMGHALAEEARRQGGKVTLVTTSSIPSGRGINRVQVETAEQMEEAVNGVAAEIAVMAAAVADFRPQQTYLVKMSRAEGILEVPLEPTPDLLAGVAARDRKPYLVGFAAESGSLDRARAKVANKGVDLLVANDISQPGVGFGTDTNQVTLMWPDGREESWPLLSKGELAVRLWGLIETELESVVVPESYRSDLSKRIAS